MQTRANNLSIKCHDGATTQVYQAESANLDFGRTTHHEACGKAIIIGEHAVIYGARAVAMPLKEMKLSLDFTASRVRSDDSPTIDITINDENIPDELYCVVDQAFDILGVKPFSFNLQGESRLIIGAGLGSSAVFCVAILRAISSVGHHHLGGKDLAELANILEGRFHGKPSGLDTSVVAFGQPIVFKRGELAQALPIKLINGTIPWRFVVIDSGKRASTKKMVELTEPYFTGAESKKRINTFDQLSIKAIEALSHGSWIPLASAMNTASTMLGEAGAIPPSLADIILAAKSNGCVAAKPTGAGGGGCILALLPPQNWEVVMTNLESKFGSTNIYKAFLLSMPPT